MEFEKVTDKVYPPLIHSDQVELSITNHYSPSRDETDADRYIVEREFRVFDYDGDNGKRVIAKATLKRLLDERAGEYGASIFDLYDQEQEIAEAAEATLDDDFRPDYERLGEEDVMLEFILFSELWVHPDIRGQGVARRLMKTVFEKWEGGGLLVLKAVPYLGQLEENRIPEEPELSDGKRRLRKLYEEFGFKAVPDSDYMFQFY